MTDGFLCAWAGDLFLHGHHMSRWIVDYVDLEESLAVGSLAQEHLGHARELLTLRGLADDDVDAFLFDRPVSQWAASRLACSPCRRFPEAVATGLLLAVATGVVVDALRVDDDEPARRVGELMAADGRLHVLHWSRWARALHRAPETRDALRDALASAAVASEDLFGQVPDSAAGGLDRMHAAWCSGVEDVLRDAGCPAAACPPPRPRRRGAHAELLAPVLADLAAVRVRYSAGRIG